MFDLVNTRLTIALAIGLCVTANANPRIIVAGTRAYLSSERVLVTISPTEAQVTATFTFRFDPDNLDIIKDLGLSVQVPIWLPDTGLENTAVQKFWQAFGGTMLHALTDDTRQPFDGTVAFSANLGMTKLTAERFQTYSSHLDSRALNFYRWAEEKVEFQKFKRDGVGCVIVEVPCRGVMLRGEAPLVVSYRQPLVRAVQASRFLYLPAFYNLPEGARTIDTNRYSITVTAATGCSLQVLNGGQRHSVSSGQSIVLTPLHHQPISATVKTGSNKSVETNRRPASPLDAGRQFGHASCAPPSPSAAVAHLWR